MMRTFLSSRWPANIGLAAINVVAFVNTPYDGFVIGIGAAIGFVFGCDAMRGTR